MFSSLQRRQKVPSQLLPRTYLFRRGEKVQMSGKKRISSFFGHPRARTVAPKFYCVTICSAQVGLPNRCPFVTLLRTALTCSFVSPALTQSDQSADASSATHATAPMPRLGTAPAPLLGPFDETRAYRIPFHIPTDREEILWFRLGMI